MIPLIGRRSGSMVARSGLGESMLWDDGQQRTLAGLIGPSWGIPSIGWCESRFPWMASSGQWNGPQPCQSRDGMGFPGPAPGQVQESRRALRVILPAERRSVTEGSWWLPSSPRAMRWDQRARLWAITCTASQAPLAGKRPEGRWFRPTPYFRSRMAFSISAWRRWSASSSRVSPARLVMKA